MSESGSHSRGIGNRGLNSGSNIGFSGRMKRCGGERGSGDCGSGDCGSGERGSGDCGSGDCGSGERGSGNLYERLESQR